MARLTMEKEYADCPFCGATDGDSPEGPMSLAVDKTGEWSVDCLKCGATGPPATTAPEAIIFWNSRGTLLRG